MEKKIPKIEPRTINSESELRHLLTLYMPGSDAQVRKTMMEGFETIKSKVEAEKKLKDIDKAEFGGFVPAPLTITPSIITLDKFIERSMGGKREGLVIKWDLQNVVWVFNPWTGDLYVETNN